MGTSRLQELRRQIAARYAALGMTQDEFAHEAGVSRGSVLRLMKGATLLETTESKLERALGWRIGSIQAIRDGGSPELEGVTESEPNYEELAKLDITEAIRILGVNDRDAGIVLGVIEQLRSRDGHRDTDADSNQNVTRRRRSP